MKKVAFVFTLLVAVACCGLQAQRPVGDTLLHADTDYFYWRHLDWFYHTEHNDTNWWTRKRDHALDVFSPIVEVGNYITGNQLYTEQPIKVVGIALCAYMDQPRDTSHSYHLHNHTSDPVYFPNTNDTTVKGRITDSAILYQIETEDGWYAFKKLAAAPWRMEQAHRYIHIPPLDTLYTHMGSHGCEIAALYEVMFNSAVVLDGSFLVASTAFNNEKSMYPRTVAGYTQSMNLWDHPATRFYIIGRYHNPDGIDMTVIQWIKYRQQDWYRVFGTGDSVAWFGDDPNPRVHPAGCVKVSYPFFPIIEPGFDTTLCHEVSNLRVAMRGYGRATLMWDAGDGGPWIVAYGKIDDAWEDFTFDTVSSPMITLTGLEVGTQYFALVRGYCGVTDEYGEWTSPLEVEIFQPGHEEPEGIEHPDDLGRFTRLVPNPARGEVNVVSSFRLSRIELYALDGRKVLEQKADGISTVVDVSGLPSGTYIAALYLPHGVATKKLLVEN